MLKGFYELLCILATVLSTVFVCVCVCVCVCVVGWRSLALTSPKEALCLDSYWACATTSHSP